MFRHLAKADLLRESQGSGGGILDSAAWDRVILMDALWTSRHVEEARPSLVMVSSSTVPEMLQKPHPRMHWALGQELASTYL